MKKIIKNLQNYSLETRKFIAWTIIIILGVGLVVWRISVFKTKIKDSAGEFQESINTFLPNEELNQLKGGIEAIGEMKDSIKELGETIKETTELLKEAEKEGVENDVQNAENNQNENNNNP